MKQTFIKKKFKEDSLLVIAQANEIIKEYSAGGYDLTLRQLFYQFVTKLWLTNTERSYKRLTKIVSEGRLAGLIDWSALIDRTRHLDSDYHWGSPAELIDYYASYYHIDKWAGQQFRVEVWIEKEALIGVIENVCRRLDVPRFACKGYVSQSFMYRAARRFYDTAQAGYETIVLHLGDHDPSGIHMTQDIEERLQLMSEGAPIEIRRLALNMKQVERYAPPPNPTKLSDTRAAAYIEDYGYESWELDALTPQVIEDLIETNVVAVRDEDRWLENVAKERRGRDLLGEAADFVAEKEELD